jgi:CheY-like chemotaxis protein
MAQRIYIKVVGFSDEERHMLNTVFRLSEQCRTMYQLWTPQAAEPARAALLDGQSWEARVEAESPLHRDLRLLWVGANPPATVWRTFQRPIVWPEIVAGLDAVFNPEAGVDLDVAAEPDSAMSNKLALIVSADRGERLYLRARLALARLTQADEAETGSEAVQLARGKQYDVALVDASLGDMDAWSLVSKLRHGRRPIPHLALTKAKRSMAEHLRAWRGSTALLEDPPDPERLDAWLSRIELGPAG